MFKKIAQGSLILFFGIFLFSPCLLAEVTYPKIIVTLDDVSISSGDIISTKPLLKASLFAPPDDPQVDIESLEIKIDGKLIPLGKVYYAETSPSSYVIRCEISDLSIDKMHFISIYVKDVAGRVGLWQVQELFVDPGEVKIAGRSRVIPATIRPSAGEGTYITYRLTRAAHVNIYIYDDKGELVWRKKCRVDAEGGKMGYNQVFWKGINSGNKVVEEGTYAYRIIAETGVGTKIIGKGKVNILQKIIQAMLISR